MINISIDEIETLRQDLDYYCEYSDDFRVWKKEKEKGEYYQAKLVIFKKYLTDKMNFYYGVIS